MKIAAFYENIKEGTKTAGVSMKQALSDLKETGLELLFVNYEVFCEDREELQPILQELDLGIEGIYRFLDFPHDEKEDRYKETIDLAVELQANHVLLIPGMVEPEDEPLREVLIQRMLAGLRLAVAYGQEKGMKVIFENFDGLAAPFNCIAGARRFLDEVPGLGFGLDTGNFIMYKEDELEGYDVLHDRICAIHLKDRSDVPVNPGDVRKTVADGTGIYPCTIGKGHIRLTEILARLKADGYDGNLVLELYDCDSSCMLEEIAYSIRWTKERI